MKKIVFAVLVMITSFSMAQNGDVNTLLDQVTNKVQSYDNVVIDFKYTLENAEENIKQETRGDVSLKGEKYLLNIMGTTQMFDGKKLYTIVPENEEVNISTYDPSKDQNITPSKMLTFYTDGYKPKWGEMVDHKGRKIQYVTLTPTTSKGDIKKIELGIDQQTKNIYNLIQTQDNGTTVTITVTSFKTNQPIPESLFQFKEERYKNYYINRLD